MGARRRTQTFTVNESTSSTPNQAWIPNQALNHRNLRKNHLGGVIFGCKNNTIKECLSKQLFGLPAQHFSFVKNIDPGLPLFLFNYSDRKLHGIFEASSSGQMNINPYAWTTNGSERTIFPAQVQIHVRQRCHPLPEEQFKPIIVDNYYSHNHFWFELDHAQANKLLSLLWSLAVAPSTFATQNTTKWRTLVQAPLSHERMEEIEGFKPPAFEVGIPHSSKSIGSDSSGDATCLDANNHPLEDCLDKQVLEKEEDLICMKLKELAFGRERTGQHLTDTEDTAAVINVHSEKEGFSDSSKGRNEGGLVNSPPTLAKLIEGMEELKVFKREQIHKMGFLEHKLVEAEIEIQQLKQRCMSLESMLHPSMARVDEMITESFTDPHLDLDESIFLLGGLDGVSWLSSFDAYSPMHDVLKSLRPMNSIRSYASIAKLNGELYVFGGGNGGSWYDTVESYELANNQWTQRPSLKAKKGSLAGATLNDRIYAIGGGNGVESFADVEMFDLDVGRWISTRSMSQQRFALAAAELNGALYAVGGYDCDRKDYLMSAERFDPREHSWTRIPSMNTKRGSHSMVVLNEKLYAIGGYDGSAMVSSIEVFDPRLGSWMTGEPMDQSRGYFGAVVVKDSIYAIGGLKTDNTILDTVEHYTEGRGWQVTNLKAIGKRSFFSIFCSTTG